MLSLFSFFFLYSKTYSSFFPSFCSSLPPVAIYKVLSSLSPVAIYISCCPVHLSLFYILRNSTNLTLINMFPCFSTSTFLIPILQSFLLFLLLLSSLCLLTDFSPFHFPHLSFPNIILSDLLFFQDYLLPFHHQRSSRFPSFTLVVFVQRFPLFQH